MSSPGRRSAALVALTALALTGGTPAAADETTPPGARLLLSIMNQPVESREAAFDETLKAPAPPAPPAGVVQPDGSVRYGKLVVTVKPPCPPHDAPPPRPGRQ